MNAVGSSGNQTKVTPVEQTACYHCGLPLTDPQAFTLNLNQQQQSFCCGGCQAVASMIHGGGLDKFYDFRSSLNKKVDEKPLDFTIYDQEALQQSFVYGEGSQKTAQLLLDGISCAACVWLIERYLSSKAGVLKVVVNAASHRCQLTWDSQLSSLSQLMYDLASIGYIPQPFTEEARHSQGQKQSRIMLMRLGLAGFGMMQVSMVAVALYAGEIHGIDSQWVVLFRWLSLLIATPIVLFSAQPFWTAAWRSLRQRHLTMDVPVSIAIVLAYLASAWATVTESGEVYFDSVSMFTFFLLLGRYFELRIRQKNHLQLGVNTQLLPMTVNRLQADNTETVIPRVELNIGDRVRVYSGEQIPCDGIVVKGETSVIEALLTGEAEPLAKKVGDPVVAGTLNADGSIVVEALGVNENTRLSAIQRLMQSAEQEKPKLQQLADRIASYFVGAVLCISLGVFFVWWQIEPASALWITLSVLVVTCPCALSLATPVALTAAIDAIGRRGLLIFRSHVIETLPAIDTVVFDKTGTLTQGMPGVSQVQCLHEAVSEAEVLSLAAALEEGSSHPIAKAFSQVAHTYRVEQQLFTTGVGVSAVIDGHHYTLGKGSGRKDISAPDNGQWLLMEKDEQALAWIGLSDPIRSDAQDTLQALKAQGLKAEILSGDREGPVKKMAAQLGDIHYQAACSPEQKLAYLKTKQAHAPVMMVGDGINDIPVLAGADISVAMDTASDLARTSADSLLLGGHLKNLPEIFTRAKLAQKIIRQNITWALVYNGVALPLAAMGWVPPYLAAIGMSASSLIVVLNALRLSR